MPLNTLVHFTIIDKAFYAYETEFMNVGGQGQ